MKLSEAIRLGAMLRPQVFGSFFIREGSCALGAALEADGVTVYDEFFRIHEEVTVFGPFPLGQRLLAACPVPSCPRLSCGFQVTSLVVHLNDHHKWTREQIADWVETLEASTPAVPQVGVAVDPAVADSESASRRVTV